MSFKSQITRVVLPAIEQQMRKVQPIVVEQVKKMQPIVVEQVKKIQPMIVAHVKKVQPIVVEQVKKIQPAVEEQIKKMQPLIKEQIRKAQPVIEEQMKKVVPWIQQQLTSSQSLLNPHHNFPVNWNVDDSISDDGKYKLKLNVKNYKPETIKVRVVKDKIVVEGEHREKSVNKEPGGMSETYLSRQFVTEFKLPDDVSTRDVQSKVGDGFVSISAIKKSPQQSKIEVNKKVEKTVL